MTPEEFRAAGHELVDWIADYLDGGVAQYPVTPSVRPGDIYAMLPEHPPAEADGFAAVMADVEQIVVPGLAHWQHPSFHGYFPANTSYPAALADLLAAGLGTQGFSWITSPACTEVETMMMDWMVDALGLPDHFRSTSDTGGGVIHGSASEATLASILAARWRATDGAVNTDGDTSGLVAYCTSQTHSSIEKGCRIAGIGTSQLRVVAHDETFAMRPDALAAQMRDDVEAGLRPFWVCATSGTTSSLAFDPIAPIAEVAHAHGAWVHVDAAMAGIAALVPEYRWVLDGVEAADSYCTDPHKWMGINFDCDLFWVRDRAALIGALSILPEYLRSKAAESGEAIDYRDWQVPLGRRFRALKLWFALRLDGVEEIRSHLRRNVADAEALAGWVADDDRFEIVGTPRLNLVCLALRAGNDATDALIEAANATHRTLLTRTVLDGRSVLRFSVGARATHTDDVRATWELLRSLA